MEQYSVIGSVPDCKSGASGVGGSSPSCSTILLGNSMVEISPLTTIYASSILALALMLP